MSTNLHVRLLGEFCLTADGLPITGVNSERLQALLAFILLHRGVPQSRQQVATHLWPDATDADAKANLRRRLHELRICKGITFTTPFVAKLCNSILHETHDG